MAANVNTRPSMIFCPNVRIKRLLKAAASDLSNEFCPEDFNELGSHAHVGLKSPIEKKVEETYH